MVNRESEQKQWWVPVWTGLVMDRDAKHYKKMKNAVWLFLYLILNANRKSGFLMRKVRTISSDMGTKKNTVLRWLSVLREQGYIATENTGRCLLIQIKKWKALPYRPRMPYQKPQITSIRGWKNATPKKSLQSQISRSF